MSWRLGLRAFVGGLVLVGFGCARPDRGATEIRSARSAQEAKRPHEALARWQKALALAKDEPERARARWAIARLARELGDRELERRTLTELGTPEASFERAQRFGDEQEIRQLLVRWPNSPTAITAARRLLRKAYRAADAGAALAEARALLALQSQGEVGEELAYQVAYWLEASGDRAAAHDAYLVHARRYPYPHGPHWDDSLFRAATLSRALEQPRRALSEIQELLAAQETEWFAGSNQRPRYAPAHWLAVLIARDDLADGALAREYAETLVARHAKSRYAGRALAELARMAADAGNERDACAAVERYLARPEPRSFRCRTAVSCPRLTPPDCTTQPKPRAR